MLALHAASAANSLLVLLCTVTGSAAAANSLLVLLCTVTGSAAAANSLLVLMCTVSSYANADVTSDVDDGAKANAKSEVENLMAIKVVVNLMTMSLLMMLPKIPSLNGDQSKSDSIMCADVILKSLQIPRMSEHQRVLMLVSKGLGEYNLGWCVRQICIFADYHFDQIVLTY